MPNRPSKEYCEALGLPYPCPEHLWHPREFTLDSLGMMIGDLERNSVLCRPLFSEIRVPGNQRTMALYVPVLFSPTQAQKIADVFKTQGVKGTFCFSSASPSYRLDDPRTKTAMAELANAGHDVGVMLDLSENIKTPKRHPELLASISHIEEATGRDVRSITFSSTGAKATDIFSRHDALMTMIDWINAGKKDGMPGLQLISTHSALYRNNANVDVCSTSNGIFKGKHPVEDFLLGGNRPEEARPKRAIFQIVDSSFSDALLWPLARLLALPEVKQNISEVDERYMQRTKFPILGAKDTFEVVPEADIHAGLTGFRPQRHEMS